MNDTHVRLNKKGPPFRRRQRGSALIMLAIMVMMFLGASVMLAAAQLSQSKSLGATYGKMQAIYAAESGVYASFDATASRNTALWTRDGNVASYQTSLSDVAPPMWIDSSGSFLYGGFTYHGHVRAYVASGRVLQWIFD